MRDHYSLYTGGVRLPWSVLLVAIINPYKNPKSLESKTLREIYLSSPGNVSDRIVPTSVLQYWFYHPKTNNIKEDRQQGENPNHLAMGTLTKTLTHSLKHSLTQIFTLKHRRHAKLKQKNHGMGDNWRRKSVSRIKHIDMLVLHVSELLPPLVGYCGRRKIWGSFWWEVWTVGIKMKNPVCVFFFFLFLLLFFFLSVKRRVWHGSHSAFISMTSPSKI